MAWPGALRVVLAVGAAALGAAVVVAAFTSTRPVVIGLSGLLFLELAVLIGFAGRAGSLPMRVAGGLFLGTMLALVAAAALSVS